MTDARVSFVARAQSFHDVDALLMNYFTFRALKETLSQMQETDLCVRELAGDGGAFFFAGVVEGVASRLYSRHSRARERRPSHD